MSVLWSGKPYIKKTIVKAFILYIILGLFFTIIPQIFIIYTILAWIFIGFYIYWKRAHTYYLMENSVLITRDWVFGKYQREITFDRIQDVHVQQGLLARIFKCGSLVFVTTSGLEVGYVVSGGGKYVYLGSATPRLLRGAWNSFIDVRFPEKVRELIMNRIVAWREVFQQQRIATAVERMANRIAPVSSISEELAKLKELLDKGIITKEEYEKAKKKLLGE
ncbi:MAG: SHOCT domain-containing protein [Desulfurococcaceae archaeon]